MNGVELIYKYFDGLSDRQREQFAALYEVYAEWKKMLDAARANQNKGSIATGMIVDTVEKIRRNNHRKRRR